MSENALTTIEKALAINLDQLKYGTIAEIGAGQEVARWFFQAGAAAGTIAKTMSAYDMDFSDAIYGADENRRYVSRARCERMLAQEYDLVVSRIKDRRPKGSRFFAYTNTVAAQGFRRRDECHGWIGIRLPQASELEPDNIVLHVRMLDDTNLEQQEALGILGVNLIYGALLYAEDPERLIRSLLDNLKTGRIEIDLVDFSGPGLGHFENRQMALELVKAKLTSAVLFGPGGKVQTPANVFYKKDVIVTRSNLELSADVEIAQFEASVKRFATERKIDLCQVVRLVEINLKDSSKADDVDTTNYLDRARLFAAHGFHVLISDFLQYYLIRQFIAHYTQSSVGIVIDVKGFKEIIRPEAYEGLDGGILEGLGKLFPEGTTVYVYPNKESGKRLTLDEMDIDDSLRPLSDYLRGLGQLITAGD